MTKRRLLAALLVFLGCQTTVTMAASSGASSSSDIVAALSELGRVYRLELVAAHKESRGNSRITWGCYKGRSFDALTDFELDEVTKRIGEVGKLDQAEDLLMGNKINEAAGLLASAMHQDNPRVNYLKGMIELMRGQYSVSSAIQSVPFFEKSAIKKCSLAQTIMGLYYANGYAGEVDHATAIKWYEKAADVFRYAQLQLAVLHAAGKGTLQNYVTAHAWANIAARKGYSAAEKIRDALAAKMSASQIAAAQEKAAALINELEIE